MVHHLIITIILTLSKTQSELMGIEISNKGKLSIMSSHQSDKRNMYLQNPARSQANRVMPASSPHSNPYLRPNLAPQQKQVP